MYGLQINNDMKNMIFLVFSVIILMVVYAYANPKVDFNVDPQDGIQFHDGSWEEALQIAKRDNKLIFLDIYATWCGPCKLLKKNTFSNDKVGAYYNSHFVNVALDGERGDGAMLAQKLRLSSYPSLYFIDGDGNVVGQTGGYHNPDALLALGKRFEKL